MWAVSCSECGDLVYPTTQSAIRVSNHVITTLYFCKSDCYEFFAKQQPQNDYQPILFKDLDNE